jgi:hypothetical protein
LNVIANAAVREPAPRVTLVRSRTVENVDSMVIWSPQAVQVCYPFTQQREGVTASSAGADRYRRARLSRCSELAEGFGELAAEPLVVVGELPVSFVGGVEPLAERFI